MSADRDALREALQVLDDFTYQQGYSATEAETHAEKALQVIRAALAAEPPALDVDVLARALTTEGWLRGLSDAEAKRSIKSLHRAILDGTERP